ncbi:mitochondrial K+-H+ exchange-related-domain-containing protein [Thelonectria olida]|uniref:Mitochondrial K+-H+ exchange-related-domain-containing protein n=1 Tax=Thelonectria olida TaxID=1576542 RepID=A0A9P9AT69_9HYPO|nr:mitochondrial K+-H+ exchange-related-domain-containing protein [Thelonectria olida]
MRLYLLPDRSYVDRGTAWAAKTWANWEKQEAGWKRKVVDYGNYAFRRIPYEEWGLKSVPPLSSRRRADELEGREDVQLCYPSSVIPHEKAEGILRTLATERQTLHRKKLIWCCVGMPITIPFALVPVIPNLPFFYLLYRAWSHWRAIAGGKHIQWVLEKKLLHPSPSKILDQLYATHAAAPEEPQNKERTLLTQKEVQTFSSTLDIPALEIELERAIWQVEQSLKDPAQETPKDTAAGAADEKAGDTTAPSERKSDESKKDQ